MAVGQATHCVGGCEGSMIKIPLSETFPPSVGGKFALHFNLLMPQFLLVLRLSFTLCR